MSYVSVQNGSKIYQENQVLQNVNLELKEGENRSLVGKSGTGKSTLLRCIAGIDTFSSGTVIIDGVNVNERPAEKRPVVLMFQQPLLFPHLTILQNVTYGLRMKRIPKKERTKAGRQLLEKMEIAELEALYPYQCSGGQQQRVALARAIAVTPKVLLLDEPFSSLDSSLRKTMRRWVKKILEQENITSMFVTHDREEAFDMGESVSVMAGGEVIETGDRDKLMRVPERKETASLLADGWWFPEKGFVPAEALRVTKEAGKDYFAAEAGPVKKQYGLWIQTFYEVGGAQSVTLAVNEPFRGRTFITPA
ncbi:ABC transporter ATP-binding protein [Marinococcus sp. PL1-022]|uniref:ABC transporter ATP-binding protein n=1 Tax=Marinococcus sp. PL1-022 TaxID=3095363 RepID=UPI0029C16650|nr:ABC transporter ATP-binding protein [Marinococcus sp. PL1-022]MDX6153761.1 ABC transporter ATP-binding protein [Marinococcus sp. PL1-022]